MTDAKDNDRKEELPEEPLTAGQTWSDLRRHGWLGEEQRDEGDKPNTQELPEPSERKPGPYVNPEK